MKKLLVFIALAVCINFTAGCSKSNPEGKEISAIRKALEIYLNSRISCNFTTAYLQISDKDKEIVSSTRYDAENRWILDNRITVYLVSNSSYTIQNEFIKVHETGDKATVYVEIHTPYLNAFKQLMPQLIITGTGNLSTGETIRNLAEDLEKNLYTTYYKYTDGSVSLPTIKEIVPINLVKENRTWKVFLDYKHRSEHGAVEAQMLATKETLFDNYIDTAVGRKQEEKSNIKEEKLREIRRLDELIAKKTHEQPAKSNAQKQDKQEYMTKLTLTETNIANTGADKIFVGKLVNNGSRVLNDVEIVLHGLDDKSKDIFVMRYHPLRDPESTFTTLPELKRFYLMQGEGIQFSQPLKNAPYYWDGVKFKAEITDIKFAE